jgi:hypothetical protein
MPLSEGHIRDLPFCPTLWFPGQRYHLELAKAHCGTWIFVEYNGGVIFLEHSVEYEFPLPKKGQIGEP